MVVGVGRRVRAAITGPVGRDCFIAQVIQVILQQLDIRKRLSPQLPLCQGHKLTDFYFNLEYNIFFYSLEHPHQHYQIISKETSEKGLVFSCFCLAITQFLRIFPCLQKWKQGVLYGNIFDLFWKWLCHLSASLFLSPVSIGRMSHGFHPSKGPVCRLCPRDSRSIHRNLEQHTQMKLALQGRNCNGLALALLDC